MRLLTYPLLILGLSAGVYAQSPMSNPVRAMPAPINAPRYGNILFPGGVSNHPTALGGTVSGNIPYTGVPPGRGGHIGGGHIGGGHSRTVVVPYAVPVYTGGYYDYPPPTSPNVTVVVPQQPAPSVIINQTFTGNDGPAREDIREYSANDVPESGGLRVYEPNRRSEPLPRRTEPRQKAEARNDQPAPEQRAAEPRPARTLVRDDKPTIFLIAMKDSTVRQAIGYWVDGNTLHYVTPQASINHLSLDMVDRDLSVQLNAERQLEFDLNK